MLYLSLLPSAHSGLQPVDVEIRAEAAATVADLAEALGQHLLGSHSGTLLAPVENGRPWPAARRLAQCGLRSGQLLAIEAVPETWRTAPDSTVDESPRAVAHVISGPDAGRAIELRDPVATIGRASDATIRLTDPDVSRRHAHVVVDGELLVVDDGSAGGTFVGGQAIRRPTQLSLGEPLRIGETVVVLRAPSGADTSATSGSVDHPGGDVGSAPVTRTPRFGHPVADVTIDLPAPPSEPARQHFPWAMMTMPLVMGISMMSMMGLGRSMFYVLGWPVAMLAGHFLQRRQHMKDYQRELEAWRVDCRELVTAADEAGEIQRKQAYLDEPDPGRVPQRLATRQLVWVRRQDDEDFLQARVGIGMVPALTKLSAGNGLPPAAVREEIRTMVASAASLPNMPVTVPLMGSKVVSIAGIDALTDRSVTNLLLRLAVAHSQFDLSIYAALSPARRDLEAVLRWLPHTRPRPGGDAGVTIGAADGRALVDSLMDLPGDQHVVCVVDDAAGIPRRAVEALAESQPHATVVWVGRSRHEAPAATGVMVDLVGGDPSHGPAVLLRDRSGVRELDHVDDLDLRTAWEWSRALAGLRDIAAVIPPDNALPGAVRVTDLGTDLANLDDDQQVLDRWMRSTGLRAAIGMGIDGLVSLDLREDGPHGLVMVS